MTEQVAACPLLRATGLQIWRGEAPLFSDVEITLREGEALFIAGRNGAGKSSLLRTLSGLGRPSQGQVEWLGGQGELSQNLLFIGHHNGLREALSALENLALYQGLAGEASDEGALEQALAHFGIGQLAEQPVRLMSQGQRRRVALCRLLLSPRRRLWVLDEPFTSLDRPSIALLETLISAHLAAKGAALITSHHQGAPAYPCRQFQLD